MKIREVLKYRNSNIAIIALTTICNCRCSMCELWKHRNKIDVSKFIENLDVLHNQNFNILQLTGGEPTLLRELPDIVRIARKKGFLVQIMTNGTTINEQLAKELADADINIVSISVDHYNDEISSKYRNFPHINERIKETTRLLKKYGIAACSTTLLTKLNYHNIDKVIEFVNNELGIPFSFCNPEYASNYFLTADSNKPDNLSRNELITTIKLIRDIKKHGASIINTRAHIRNTLAWLENGKGIYTCKSGKNVIFIDWNMNVFPCFIKPKICKLDELPNIKLADMQCDECMTQCFREPSIYYHGGGKLEYAMDFNMLFGMLKGAISKKSTSQYLNQDVLMNEK